LIEKVFQRCEIRYNEEIIEKEHLIKQYRSFMCNTFYEKNHNVSVVLHTGSICFDIVSLIFAVFSNLVLNEEKVDSLVESLEEGDLVVYEKSRYVFKSITEEKATKDMPLIKYANLEQKNGVRKVPEKLWYKITPYKGESTSLSGKGLKTKANKRNHFISSVFEIDEKEIPGIIRSSTVVVMSKGRADHLIGGITLHDKVEEMDYSIPDLATISYNTEGGVIYYSGNPEKNDTNIKITSKLSVARNLIYNPDTNKVNGLIVLESDGANQSITELNELMKRRSLRFVFVSYSIISSTGEELAVNTDDINLFACTKDFLLENSMPLNTYNAYTGELAKQVDYIVDKEIEPVIIDSNITGSEYKKVIRSLLKIKRSDFLDEKKEEFVIQAFSLVNLLITAPFPMMYFDEFGDGAELKSGLLSPSQKISLLEDYCNGFSPTIKEWATPVFELIKKIYDNAYFDTPKQAALKKILTKSRGEKTVIIIPKAYYESILSDVLDIYMGTGKISFRTPNRFNNLNFYDRIIVLGNLDGKRFDTFKCHSAKLVNVLLYDFEKQLYNYKRKEALISENELNKKLKLIDYDEPDLEETEADLEAKELAQAIKEADDYIWDLNAVAIRNYVSNAAKNEGNTINAVRLGRFAEGESILFSKNYKATVFIEESGTVIEKDIKDLEPGDNLVFTKNDSVTKGIVDEILENLLKQGLLEKRIESAYEKSQYWKSALKRYVVDNSMSYDELGKRMNNCGSTKDYQTIRSWIQPFSHIVGPRDEESYYHIAKVTGDERMLNDPKSFCDACSIIRLERMQILKLIAEAIVKKLGGKEESGDKIFSAVYDNVENISIRRQLEDIMDLEEEYAAPFGMINRPIDL